MNKLQYFLHKFLVICVSIIKRMELQFLRPFTPLIKKFAVQHAKSAGVIIHCADDTDEIKTDTSNESENTNLVHCKVNDSRFFAQVANQGILAYGQAFKDKTLDVFNDNYEDITEIGVRFLTNNLQDLFYHPLGRLCEWLEFYAFDLKTVEQAFKVGKTHYAIGEDLFERMLDPWMQYTCGYWKNADNLNEAQIKKMELIAKKLNLKPGMRVLDIGCGWGTLCKYLAQNYHVKCVGVTIGEIGAKYGKRVCAGLPVDIRLQDYRKVKEKFDRIISVGMEHAGVRNYRKFFKVAKRCLKDGGLFLLHTMARNQENVRIAGTLTNKHIVSNGNLLNPESVVKLTKDVFVIEDWHTSDQDYEKTIFCWRENILKHKSYVQSKRGEEFFRMWMFYLSTTRALYKAKTLQLWQLVLSKGDLKQNYHPIR